MPTITKGPIGAQDLYNYDGVNDSFSRLTSDGYTLTLQPVGQYVDVIMVYGGGVNYTNATITLALTAIGTTNKRTLIFRPGTWTVSANVDWSAYTNVTFKFLPGAVLSHGAFTINIPNIDAGLQQVFSGTGAVTLSGYHKEIYPEWWGALPDDSTDSTAALQAAIYSLPDGGVISLNVGTYLVDSTKCYSGTYAGTDLVKYEGIHFRGQGRGITILKTPAGTIITADREDKHCTLILSDSEDVDIAYISEVNTYSKNMTVSDLTLDGNLANLTVNTTASTYDVCHSGIFTSGTVNLNVYNVEAKNYVYGGLVFASSLYGTFNNLYTANNGSVNYYAGVMLNPAVSQGALYNSLTNHVSKEDGTGLWMLPGSIGNYVETVAYEPQYIGFALDDLAVGESYGNEVHSVIYGGADAFVADGWAFYVGGTDAASTHNNKFFITVHGSNGHGGYVAQGSHDNYFHVSIEGAQLHGFMTYGYRDTIDLFSTNNSLSSPGGYAHIAFLAAAPILAVDNTCNLYATDTDATPAYITQFGTGTSGNLLNLMRCYQASAVCTDGGTGNQVIVPRTNLQTIAYGANITPDLLDGTVICVTLTGNVEFAVPSNGFVGQRVTFILTQDGGGGHTTTFTGYLSTWTPNTTGNKVNVITFIVTGTPDALTYTQESCTVGI
jgi:hypothetical protein